MGVGTRVLIPRAQDAREVLPQQLRDAGALVDVVPLYRTRVATPNRDDVASRLVAGEIDFVTFTSASTVRGFVEQVGEGAAQTGQFQVAVIGPVSAAAARDAGMRVAVEASEYTIGGLVTALTQHVRDNA